MPIKTKLTFTSKYKKDTFFVEYKNPILKHVPEDFTVHRMALLAAGTAEVDGVKMEYQDLRVYLKTE